MSTTFWGTTVAGFAPSQLSAPTPGEQQVANPADGTSPNAADLRDAWRIPGAAEGSLGALLPGHEDTLLAYRAEMRTMASLLTEMRLRGEHEHRAALGVTPNPDPVLPNGTTARSLAALRLLIGASQTAIDGHVRTLIEGGLHPSQVTARGLFQSLDAETVLMAAADLPPDYDLAAPPTFPQWHSAVQAQWLDSRGVAPGLTLTLRLGGTDYHYMRSTDGIGVILVNQLSLADIGMMSPQDQYWLTLSGRGWTDLSTRLNLTTIGTQPAVAARHLDGSGIPLRATPFINNLLDQIANSAGSMQGNEKVFSDQVMLLVKRANAGTIVSTAILDDAARDIGKRFERALAFKTAPRPVPIVVVIKLDGELHYSSPLTTKARYNPISIDDNASIDLGFAEFMRAERAICASAKARDAIAPMAGRLRDPRADVPNLIFRLQSLYENAAAGLADAGTEEIAQLHELLNIYALMQRMVNDTSKSFDPGKTSEVRRFMNVGDGDAGQAAGGGDVYFEFHQGTANGAIISTTTADDEPRYAWFERWGGLGAGNGFQTDPGLMTQLTNAEMRAFSMFASDPFTNAGSVKHPLEALLGVTRPLQDMVGEGNGEEYSLWRHHKTKWDTFGTQLSDAVTQLNQKNQIKQNDVENATKQRNRHFELGNNALSKMNDMLMAIGRM